MLYVLNTFKGGGGGLEMFHDVLLNLRKVFRALEIKFVHRSTTPVFVGVSSFFT